MPRRARIVWWLLGAYLALTVVGDVVYDVLQYHLGESPFPSWADAFYLASYVPQIAALIILLRQRQRVWNRQAWIDSAVITVAAVCVAATLVLLPMLAQSTPSDFVTYLAIAYPLLDLVVLAILIRLTVGGGRPMTSLLLLTVSVLVTLMADLVYNGLAASGTIEDTPRWLDALFTGGILLLVFAVTAPRAASIGQPSPHGAAIMSAARTVALGVGALTAPVLLALQARDESTSAAFFLATASIIVNILVIWRILLLLATVRTQSDALDLLARTDALTGLPNRRSWNFALERADEATRAAGTSLTVAMVDIDHFKEFNDEHGHVAGDDLLKACAEAWRTALDASVFLARYGGEEFAAFLEGQSPSEVVAILERCRLATPASVTVSIGCARHESDEPIVATLQRADQALYAAKAAGRDRLVVASVDASLPDPAAAR
jgi:diguanylate cyclase (GGDEF)-like protein